MSLKSKKNNINQKILTEWVNNKKIPEIIINRRILTLMQMQINGSKGIQRQSHYILNQKKLH